MDKTQKEIPKILHQTWKDHSIPATWRFAVDSWPKHHPDWAFHWWTDADNQKFVETTFPEFLPTWERYPYPILRADAIRYLLLYHFGGVYADLDLECLRPVNLLLEKGLFIAGREPEEHIVDSKQVLFCNAFMAAPPGHPFLAAVIEALKQNEHQVVTHSQVLDTTGPAFLQQVLERYPGNDVRVQKPGIFYPMAIKDPKIKKLLGKTCKKDTLRKHCVNKGAYTIHYWSNSWIKNQWGTLHNPQPHDIPGFVFFPDMDSPGSDVANVGRDIPALAEEYRDNRAIHGFNTDGFIKSEICPRWKWRPFAYGEPGVGLYIKPEHVPPWTLREIAYVCFVKIRVIWRKAIRICSKR